MRIDIQINDESLDEVLASLEGDERLIVDTYAMKENALSGKDAAKFIAISMASGIIGNLSYDAAKSIADRISEIVVLEASEQKPVELKLDGVTYRIAGDKDVKRFHGDIIEAVLPEGEAVKIDEQR